MDEYFGLNVFVRADDRAYRTYFTNARAADAIGNVWSLLDLTPLGRQEDWEDSPRGYPQGPPYSWWKLHDEYDAADADGADRPPMPTVLTVRRDGHSTFLARSAESLAVVSDANGRPA